MQVVITGGAGFLGVALARAVLAAGQQDHRGSRRTVDRVTLVDRVAPPPDLVGDPRVVAVVGDLLELLEAPADQGPLTGADVVYHLAAAVSGEAEADFDLGMRANVAGSQAVLEAGRALGTSPVFVFASSLAVYGAWPGQPLPDVVTDQTLATPRNSYGIQKLIVEQLVADYTRKGFVDGRSVRLMTVSVRPGRPNGAASSFLSGIVREPVNGERAACPVPAEMRVAVSSPERTLEGLLLAGQVDASTWGPPTAVNLPALEVSVGDMVGALGEVAGPDVAALVDWVPDPVVADIVGSWPSRFDTGRALGLGLTADPDYQSVVRAFLDGRAD